MMALIKCPECGKNISSLAKQCIHCGFPLEELKNKTELVHEDIRVAHIYEQLETYCKELDGYSIAPRIRHPIIENEINNIYNDALGMPNDNVISVNDKIALLIFDILNQILPHHESWGIVYAYCSMIKFDNISDDTMQKITNILHSKILSYNPPQYWDDGSYKTNSNYIVYWYPLYQVLTHGNDNVKNMIYEALADNHSPNSKEKKLDYIYKKAEKYSVWMPSNYSSTIKIDNINTPKCPRCGSTSITAGQRGYTLLTGFLGSNKTMNRCANCGHKWEPRR